VTREWAIIPALTKFGVNFWNVTAAQIAATTQHYISCGVTTAHDMLSSMIDPIVYHSLGDTFPIDINGYYWITSANLTNFQTSKNYQTSRFKVAGTKLVLDGSIQAYTGYFTKPYWVP
jgi:predicted amidohydrolase YtcJ